MRRFKCSINSGFLQPLFYMCTQGHTCTQTHTCTGSRTRETWLQSQPSFSSPCCRTRAVHIFSAYEVPVRGSARHRRSQHGYHPTRRQTPVICFCFKGKATTHLGQFMRLCGPEISPQLPHRTNGETEAQKRKRAYPAWKHGRKSTWREAFLECSVC